MSCPRGCCVDYKTHIRGVNIGSLPTQIAYTERKWEKDMGAFKRLVDEGHHPGRLEGAYVMERSATHPREIEQGRKIDPQTLSLMDEVGI